VRYTFEEYALEELTFLGIASSTAFEREPEGNGCVERRGYQAPRPSERGSSRHSRRRHEPRNAVSHNC
jgi:hypothetical protein